MIKLRCLFSLVLLLLVSTGLKAQKGRIFLKNGSVLRGTIETSSANSLSIRTDSASVLRVNIGSISGVAINNRRKSTLRAEMILLIDSLNKAVASSKFYHQVRFGMLNGEDGTFLRNFSSLSMDYTFFRKSRGSLHAGLGVALDYYTSFMAMPFYLELRQDFGKRPSHPFVYGRLGYSLARARTDFEGNFGDVLGDKTWALGAGYQWPLGKSSILFSMGVKEQELRTVWRNRDFYSSTDWFLKRLDFKVGFIF
ncbi:MAG: hypothetical protein HEP71_21870 [Roseivirga sp.]|nr:hypothetical protein [Roseivirga sp.]